MPEFGGFLAQNVDLTVVVGGGADNSRGMSEKRIEDRWAIGELMTGWIHRDREQWDELAGLFHADATLETAGHPIAGSYPTRFSAQEAAILEAGSAWLAESNVAQN